MGQVTQVSHVSEWRHFPGHIAGRKDEVKHYGLSKLRKRKLEFGPTEAARICENWDRKELCIKGAPEICTGISLDFRPNIRLCKEQAKKTNTKQITITKERTTKA